MLGFANTSNVDLNLAAIASAFSFLEVVRAGDLGPLMADFGLRIRLSRGDLSPLKLLF
jgi:hypothetical protein